MNFVFNFSDESLNEFLLILSCPSLVLMVNLLVNRRATSVNCAAAGSGGENSISTFKG